MKNNSLSHLAAYICKQNGIAVIATSDVEVPFADRMYKIIYLPPNMANLNNPLNVGILLQQAGSLQYTQMLNGDELIKNAAKVGLDQATIQHLCDSLVSYCEAMRVESKLINRYMGAERYISEIYGPKGLPLTEKHPAGQTCEKILTNRFFPLKPQAYDDLPKAHQEFFDLVNENIPEIEESETTLDLLQLLFEKGIMAKFLELWPPSDNPPKSKIDEMLAALAELLKKAGAKLGEVRKDVSKKEAQRIASNYSEGEVIQDPSDPGEEKQMGGHGLSIDYGEIKEEEQARIELAKRADPYIPGLIRTLKKMKSHGYTKTLLNQKKGHLNNKHLVRVFTSDSGKVFKQKQLVRTNHKAAVTVVIDKSGSMWNQDGRMGNAVSSAYLVATALEMINRPVRITCFYDFVNEIKGWKSRSWTDKLLKTHPQGSNADGDAVEEARKDLEKRSEEDKIIIMLTDGGVCQGEKLNKELTKARKAGMRVFGIAIGDSTINETRRYYGDKFSYDAGRVENLPRVMATLLKDAKLL